MSPLVPSAVPPEMIQEYQSAAYSSKLDALLAEVVRHFEDATSKTKTELVDALADIREECAAAGWDGHEARPIESGTLQEADFFMKQLPYSVARPHVAPAASGAVAFEWRRGRDNIMMVTVFGSKKIAYAIIIDGTRKIHGMEPFIESIPQRIEELLVSNFRSA